MVVLNNLRTSHPLDARGNGFDCLADIDRQVPNRLWGSGMSLFKRDMVMGRKSFVHLW